MLKRSIWDSVIWGWSSYSQTEKGNPAKNVGDGITVGREGLEVIPGYPDPGKESQCLSISLAESPGLVFGGGHRF